MFSLLPLLTNLRDNFNVDVLAFETVHIKLYLIHEEDHAALTVAIPFEIIVVAELENTVFRKVSLLILSKGLLRHFKFTVFDELKEGTDGIIGKGHIGHKLCMRICVQQLIDIVDRRERLARTLSADEDRQAVRVEIIRVSASETSLIAQPVAQDNRPLALAAQFFFQHFPYLQKH